MPHLDSTRDVVYYLADRWFTLKTALEVDGGINDTLLHVGGGLLLQLCIATLFRLPLASMLPWLVVFGVEVTNEVSDLYWSGLKGDDNLLASTLDTLATMLLPTVVLLVARARPETVKPLPAATPSDEDEIAGR